MSIEAMKQALEALEKMVTPRNFQTHQFCQKAYDDLRQAIAEAEKQQRTWVGLTEEEKIKLWDRAEKRQAYQGVPAFIALIQEVEAKLKERNK